jgi:hypothetical protein
MRQKPYPLTPTRKQAACLHLMPKSKLHTNLFNALFLEAIEPSADLPTPTYVEAKACLVTAMFVCRAGSMM